MSKKETLQQKVWDYIRRNPNFRAGDILMLIPISKAGLIRYLVALTKAEYLQQKAMETRPKHFEDNEYTLIKKVGVCAPKYNRTALYDPNTKTTYPLSDGELKSVRDGAYVDYALSLGQLPKFLSNYKYLNPHLLTAKECYEDYLAKQKEQTKLIAKVKKIHSFLIEKRQVIKFGEYLCEQKFFKKSGSYVTAICTIPTEVKGLIRQRAIKNYKGIIQGFKRLYGDIETLEDTAK